MSSEKVERCPICGGSTFRPFLACKDYTTTGEVFQLQQCVGCEMLITNPRPTQSSSSAYYQSSKYISHKSGATGILDHIYLLIRQLTMRWKFNMVKPYLKHMSLLDVGCGTGNFLHHCQKAGVTVSGVEVSSTARTQAQAKKITVVDSIENLSVQKFDVVTLWHVLEHVYDLPGTINLLKDKLTENGIIFIAVPNWKCHDANQYKEMWAGYDVPRHIWHFSETQINTLLQNAGLQLKKVIPMKLDSYYVSMLSEKNRADGKLNIQNVANAIKMGYRSNKRASLDMNYSSLIYLVQK